MVLSGRSSLIFGCCSFVFKWPQFSEEFHRDARAMLENALNKGNKPPIIADKIEVIELEMGTEVRQKCSRFFMSWNTDHKCVQPPELQIREIGDLTLDQFRGIFRLSYSGNAHIVLRTKVQVRLAHTTPNFILSSSKFTGKPAQPQTTGYPHGWGI